MTKKKSIVFDLDGTLCTIKTKHESYSDVQPIKEMVELVNTLHDEGYEIIIHTARNMVTQNNDIGKVVANVGKVTLEWLNTHNVKYHSLVFGKPYSSTLYVDDKSCLNDPEEIKRRLAAIETGTEEEYIKQQKNILSGYYS